MHKKNIQLIILVVLLTQVIQVVFINDVYGEGLDTNNNFYIAYSKKARGGIYSQIIIIKEDDYNAYLKGEDLYGMELINFKHYRDKSMLEEEYIKLQEEINLGNILFDIGKEYKEGRKLIYSEDNFKQEYRISGTIVESDIKETILKSIEVKEQEDIRSVLITWIIIMSINIFVLGFLTSK